MKNLTCKTYRNTERTFVYLFIFFAAFMHFYLLKNYHFNAK